MKKLELKIILMLSLVLLFVMVYFIPMRVDASGYNDELWFEEGDQLTLVGIGDESALTLSGADYDFTTVEWESKDSNIVSVDENGNIRAVGVGSTYIYAAAVIEEDETEAATSSTASASVASSNEATPSIPHKREKARCRVTVTNEVNEDWQYIEYEGELKITDYTGTDLDVVIPEEIDGMPVTSLMSRLFKGMALTSVVMPDSVREIGNDLFYNCDSLTYVRLSDKLKILPSCTFKNCISLESVELPNQLEELYLSAFHYSTIKELSIPEFVNQIHLERYFSPPDTITEYKVHPDNQYFKSDEGMLLNKAGDTLYCYPLGTIHENDVVKLPDSITRLVSLPAMIKADYRVPYDIYLGDKITSIDNVDHLPNKYKFVWADPDSYIYQTLRVHNVTINPAKEWEFDEIMSSGFKVMFKDDNTLCIMKYNGRNDVMDIPSYFGSIKVTGLDDGLFFNESVGTIIIPETFQEITSDVPKMGFGWSLDRCRNIHKIVNNSPFDIPFVRNYNSHSRGWYDQEFSGGTKLEKIPANSTVYKHYGIYYGGFSESQKYSLVDNYGYNEEFKLLPPPPKSGYTFIGWTTMGKPGSEEREFISSIPAGTNDNVSVYAYYERNTSGNSSGGGGGGGGGGFSPGLNKTAAPSAQNTPGTWEQNEHGWRFQKQDGTYPKDEWIMNNNTWYRFDQNGYMQSGWIEINNVKYFLNPDGAMVSNDWSLQNGKWYYFDESGAMQTGWVKWKDSWYYLNADGTMATDTVTPDGFRVGADGAWRQ